MMQLTGHAQDPTGGMTLAELSEFVAQARAAGHPDSSRIRAAITWRGKIKSLMTVVTGGDRPTPR